LLKSRVEAADSTIVGMGTAVIQGGSPETDERIVRALRAGNLLAICRSGRIPFHSRSIRGKTQRDPPLSRGSGVRSQCPGCSLDTATVEQTTVAGIFFLTEEVTKAFTPASAAEINNSMVRVITRAVDLALMDPEYALSVPRTPRAYCTASPRWRLRQCTEVGVTAAVLSMGQTLDDAGSDLRECDWCMRPRTAQYLSTLKTAGGALAYPASTMLARQGGPCSR
jgi:hypothetical protein